MKHTDIIQRCIALEAKLDQQLFEVYRDPVTGQYVRADGAPATVNDFKSVGGALKAAAVFGGGSAAAVGARSGIRALKSRYGADQVADPRKAGQALIRGVGRDVSAASSVVAGQAKDALARIRKSGLLSRVGRMVRGVRFDARQKLIELAAK